MSQATEGILPRVILIMGVSGAGKSSLGRELAAALGFHFVDADDLHSPESIRKMTAGIALTDEDRGPWIGRVGDALASRSKEKGCVAACSALKRKYRDQLRKQAGPITLVHPEMTRREIKRRLQLRTGHFMSAQLIDSQLATLERPAADEEAIIVSGSLPISTQVNYCLTQLRAS